MMFRYSKTVGPLAVLVLVLAAIQCGACTNRLGAVEMIKKLATMFPGILNDPSLRPYYQQTMPFNGQYSQYSNNPYGQYNNVPPYGGQYSNVPGG